jgi:hypothetical protein
VPNDSTVPSGISRNPGWVGAPGGATTPPGRVDRGQPADHQHRNRQHRANDAEPPVDIGAARAHQRGLRQEEHDPSGGHSGVQVH